MSIFDICIAYVSWGSGGKRRPVMILSQTADSITVFRITSKYKDKSEAVREKYFLISDWQQAGLDKQSYADTSATVTLPRSSVDTENPIGTLTEADIQRLIDFLS